MNCSRDVEQITQCWVDANGVCAELVQNTIFNPDGTPRAWTYTLPTDPNTVVDVVANGWTYISVAPCQSKKETYRYCNAGVCANIYKVYNCAGVATWQNEDGTAYTPSGVELAGACTDADFEVEILYDVVDAGLATQTCTPFENRKTVKCDGSFTVATFDLLGAPYVVVGIIMTECPCVNLQLGFITSWTALQTANGNKSVDVSSYLNTATKVYLDDNTNACFDTNMTNWFSGTGTWTAAEMATALNANIGCLAGGIYSGVTFSAIGNRIYASGTPSPATLELINVPASLAFA